MKQVLSVFLVWMSFVLTSPLATVVDSGDDVIEVEVEPDSGPQLPNQEGLVQQSAAVQTASAPAPAEPHPKVSAAKAAKNARHAAKLANKVAMHSKKIIDNSKKGLGDALHALHEARVDSKGLKAHQKKSLKAAEADLREATKKAEYGKLDHLQAKFKSNDKGDKEQMKAEIGQLRSQIKAKCLDDPDLIKEIDGLEAAVDKSDGEVSDEAKATFGRLRTTVDGMESECAPAAAPATTAAPVANEDAAPLKRVRDTDDEEGPVTPIQEKGIDIDTQMPYGDLEPFGREDTAQELTESSIKESDEMVDQLERAEVAEEKRAVFRALTRLRGAAITSFDGVARSQTGNIDEYNKVNKWRSSHPLHHLADEESDVSKWAFPDNAD